MHLTLEASSYQKEPTRFDAEIATFAPRKRLARAATVAGPLLLGAVLSVPIPGWHFVGVPGFLIASFVFGRQRLLQDRAFECARGPCPACGAEHQIEIPAAATLPVTVRCPGCGEFLKLDEPPRALMAAHRAPDSP